MIITYLEWGEENVKCIVYDQPDYQRSPDCLPRGRGMELFWHHAAHQ